MDVWFSQTQQRKGLIQEEVDISRSVLHYALHSCLSILLLVGKMGRAWGYLAHTHRSQLWLVPVSHNTTFPQNNHSTSANQNLSCPFQTGARGASNRDIRGMVLPHGRAFLHAHNSMCGKKVWCYSELPWLKARSGMARPIVVPICLVGRLMEAKLSPHKKIFFAHCTSQ